MSLSITVATAQCRVLRRMLATSYYRRSSSTSTSLSSNVNGKLLTEDNNSQKSVPTQQTDAKSKTMAEMDEQLRKAMEGIAGDGGVAGLELEDGKPVAMKRGVRDNMFRYI